MPDLGVAVLDVVIGLIFVFVLLSIVCSGINELIAALFNLRGRTLEQGVRSLLDDPKVAERFFAHPRFRALKRPGKTRLPSYLPPRVFALTVLDTVVPPDADARSADGRDLVKRAAGAVALLPEDSALRVVLRDAVADAGSDRDRLRASIERSFDDVMDRAGGWYKRRVQVILLVIAVVIVGAANADTFTIADRLWKDDALRTAIVEQATQAPPAERAAGRPCTATPARPATFQETADCIDGLACSASRSAGRATRSRIRTPCRSS